MKLTSLLCRKKLPWTPITLIFLVSATIVTVINASSASSPTYLYVDPPEVRDVQPGDTFSISVNVTDAPPSYAWEVYLGWDPTLLNVTGVTEGDWLHRWDPNPFPPPDYFKKYATSIAYTPENESNLNGEMIITCSLVASLPVGEWASGDGWLVTLNFTVKAEGSSTLNLYRTRLWDHMEAGYPAPTYYVNEDGFFSNVAVHDIAVANVTSSTTDVTPGEPVNITVTVKNEGNFTETFSVTVYADVIAYNTTLDIVIGDEIAVGTQTGITLDAGNSITLPTFTWDTTGVAGETYTISANATITSSVDDDPSDNTLIDDTVTVTWDHDLKIGDITVLTPEVLTGEVANITVTLLNQGNNTESFNLNVNATETIIETISDSLSAGANRTYDISWDTTGVAGETYTISAYVPPVSGEVDPNTADNTLIDDTVTVTWDHDLKIIDITVSNTSVYVGDVVNITVTVLNQGSQQEINFEVYAYADLDPMTLRDEHKIGPTITSLAKRVSTTLTFPWNTVNATEGTHTISAYVPPVSGEVDPNTADNTLIDDTVHARIGYPVAEFTENATTVLTGETIHFDASNSEDSDGVIVSYFWDFGDGTNATGVTADHAYADDGTYTVTLTVTDNDGLTNSTSATKTVNARATSWPLSWYAAIGLGIAVLVIIALYALYRRKKG